MVNDLADEAAIVEDRARRICVTLKADPNEVLDPYGPVLQWGVVAYHIGEAIKAASRPAEQIAESANCPVPADVADLVEYLRKASGWRDDRWRCCVSPTKLEEAASLLSALASGRDEWLPIEAAPMWVVAVVTDGERAAVAQRAENDWGGAYWAVDPEDGLDWEPTHYRTPPQSDQQ